MFLVKGNPMTAPIRKKFTVPHLYESKVSGHRISMVTAYDATFAHLADIAGVEVLLVGDSVGMVLQGKKNTLGVTLDHMCYHTQMVAQSQPKALIVGDMPFGSYQTCHKDAIASAVQLIQHGAEVVKLEGGIYIADTVAAIVEMDIPVMGHVGLTPQSYHRMGGNRVQARTTGDHAGSRQRVIEDALAVESAGACAIVLEGIPLEVAREITQQISIPTIGIGAGPHCDGQVLVLHDVLGISEKQFTFSKPYADLRTSTIEALRTYVSDVHTKVWPDEDHSFT
jgi:3-methyl-2-oxobutanoate hydroxymethyltransferase